MYQPFWSISRSAQMYRLLECPGVAAEAAGRRHTVQELVDLYRSARRWLALPRSLAVAMGVLAAKDGNA